MSSFTWFGRSRIHTPKLPMFRRDPSIPSGTGPAAEDCGKEEEEGGGEGLVNFVGYIDRNGGI